jgi:hypothetical protein
VIQFNRNQSGVQELYGAITRTVSKTFERNDGFGGQVLSSLDAVPEMPRVFAPRCDL